jgi:hypothetical protein
VATNAAVTATLSEPVQAETVAFVLTDSGGARVAASTAYDAATRTVTLRPTAPLAPGTVHTASLSGAQDAAGNTMAPVSWSFTTAPAPPTSECPCTVFGTSLPAVAADPDTAAVELGMRFRASRAGEVTGVRFYKGPGNTGVHTASLWTNSGTPLATATFSAETASGWQQVDFTSPVPITRDTTYVVSYYAPVGRYAKNPNFFKSTSTTSGPLTALRNGTDGANGVYRYGAGGGFPTTSHRASNYWVDVVFR